MLEYFMFWWNSAPHLVAGMGLTVFAIIWAMIAASVTQKAIQWCEPIFVLVPLAVYATAMYCLIAGGIELDPGWYWEIRPVSDGNCLAVYPDWLSVAGSMLFLAVFTTGGLLATTRQNGVIQIHESSLLCWFLEDFLRIHVRDKNFTLCNLSWTIIPALIVMPILYILWFGVLNAIGWIVLLAVLSFLWLLTGKSPWSYFAEAFPYGIESCIWTSCTKRPEIKFCRVGGIPTSPLLWAAVAALFYWGVGWLIYLYIAYPLWEALLITAEILAGGCVIEALIRKFRRDLSVERDPRYDPLRSMRRNCPDRFFRPEQVLPSETITAVWATAQEKIPPSTTEHVIDLVGGEILGRALLFVLRLLFITIIWSILRWLGRGIARIFSTLWFWLRVAKGKVCPKIEVVG